MESLPEITPEMRTKYIERIKTDERFFVEACLSILDKSRQLVPFKLNHVQALYEKTKTRFDMILKARKMGFSTRIIAGDIWACAFKKNEHRVLISHTDDATKKLLEEKVKPILNSCTLPLGVKETKQGLFFPSTGSRYYIGTAGSKTFGRGDDITGYHLTEYAHYENPDIITGIEEACTDNAVGRIETTANGTNFFQLDWNKAQNGQGLYKPVFFAWWQDPQYKIPGGTITNPTEEEAQLKEAFGLSFEQLAWRRWKINTMNRPELFPQEYPSNPEEAFLSSGRMVFDWVALLSHEKRCEEPKWTGTLRDMGENIELIPSANGQLKVWQVPQPRHIYVIGGDVAEGLKDGCYSAAFVLDAGTGQQVAEWHGHIAPDRFGDVMVTLGQFYNTALLAPEAWPGPGAVTMARINQIGYRNLYQRPERSNRTETAYGWETTQSSKPQMLLSLAGEGIRDLGLIIKSKELLNEMRSLVYNEKGAMEPNLGCFSDRVIAAGIAWYVSRDIAAHADYSRPKLRMIRDRVNGGGSIFTPQWKGSRYGVRA